MPRHPCPCGAPDIGQGGACTMPWQPSEPNLPRVWEKCSEPMEEEMGKVREGGGGRRLGLRREPLPSLVGSGSGGRPWAQCGEVWAVDVAREKGHNGCQALIWSGKSLCEKKNLDGFPKNRKLWKGVCLRSWSPTCRAREMPRRLCCSSW